MASVDISTPKLYACNITAYNDVELDRYLEENGRYVDVEDPENLPNDFIQRLRDRTHRTNETAQSRPIDLDAVAARLQNVSADKEQSFRLPSPAATDPGLPEEEQYLYDVQLQTKYYKALVDEGGRPSHPLSRLESIINDPGEYREILSFWQSNEDQWDVFLQQLWNWQAFRGVQRFARGQRGYDYWRSIWEEDRKRQSFKRPRMQVHTYTEEDWEFQWTRYQRYDNTVQLRTSYISWEAFVKRDGQTNGQLGFPEYAEAIKDRLARHGFTWTFQLEEDVTRQDKLTTWIEYLGYEYWWYDYHAGIARRLQKRHDNAWNKLVESKVLRPKETEEFVCNIDTSFQRASEEERAKRAMQFAMSAVSSAETAMSKSQRSRLSSHALQQRLLAARSKLKMVHEEFGSIKRRNDCITEFIQRIREYRIAKEDAEHHEVLLRWILQQVPLIGTEPNPPNERGSDRRGEGKMLKRKRSDEVNENQHSQEQRGDEGVSKFIPDQLAVAVVVSQEGNRHDESPSKRPKYSPGLSHNTVLNSAGPKSSTGTLKTSKSAPKTESTPRDVKRQASSGQLSRIRKPLRRSPRIAERVERLNAANSAARLAQAPTLTLSTLSKKRKGKRDRPALTSQRHTSKPQGVSKKKGRTHS